MTPVIVVDPDCPDEAALAEAGGLLRAGRLVAFPTETVYGLGAHALDPAAVRRVFAAKGRPAADPLIVHILSAEAIGPLVAVVPPVVMDLAAAFWPGPLTMVLPRSDRVPDEVTAGLGTVAIRVPAHPVARALLRAAAVPVAAPSANLFSRPSPTCAAHVLQDLEGRIDLLVDGGGTAIGVESTVIFLAGDRPTILRPGAITIEMLRAVVPEVTEGPVQMSMSALPSPGLLERHYSPRSPLTLYEGPEAMARLLADARAALDDGLRIGVLIAAEDRDSLTALDRRVVAVRDLGSRRDPAGMGTRLYAALRDLDQAGLDRILARGIDDQEGFGRALQDRLRRAAAGDIVRARALPL